MTPRATQCSIASSASARVLARGLLAQDVLAGVGGPLRPRRVEVVRERDVDRVDRVVGEQLLVGAGADGVAKRDTAGGRQIGLLEEVGRLGGLARDRCELDALRPEDRGDHDLARDVRGAQNTDAQHGPMLQRGPA